MKIKRTLANNLFILGMAVKAAPFTVIYLLLAAGIHSVVVYFEHTYQIVFIIDSIQYGRPFAEILRFIVIMFFIVTLNMAYRQYFSARIEPKGKEKIYRALRERLFAKAKSMDIACYDDPAFFNDFVFAMNNATQRVDAVINTVASLISGIMMLIVLGGYMLLTDRISVIFVFVSFAVSFLFRVKISKLDFKLNEKLNPILRKRDYINRIFYLPDYVKEIRLNRIKERLYEDYAQSETNVYETLKKPSRKIAIIEFLQDYITGNFIFDLVYLVYLMFMTIVRGALGFGALFGLFRSAQWASGTINDFSGSLAQLQEHSLYIEKVRTFLSYELKITSGTKPLPPPVGELPDPTTPLLEMRNVSFTYPAAQTPTLTDVNMTINRGEKIAIVGYNGAGKTTLVKLLMRLYDPDAGEIRYGGEDIRAYGVSEYRDLFATLFQDYQIYAATVTQNVLASNAPPDADRLTLAIEMGGFAEKLAKMPNGLESQLTNEFTDGEELSGGERQKLATSRSLYKNSPIIIMDEPSSALDPIAEYELNNTMMNLGGKTVIFISHRLSTTKMADKIYMFEEGRLTESGSHADLLALNGKYAEMYQLQAEKYR
ncbi:MAG: ABC transporter ATP-binding protein/permease [Defluviitaleaceae bacterium]|nr:ABC transporter ATP-binding protein/permease [Defluviitaleaceae bacterium]